MRNSIRVLVLIYLLVNSGISFLYAQNADGEDQISVGKEDALLENMRFEGNSYSPGEWLKFDMSYSKFISAGFAEIEITEDKVNDKLVWHIKGLGKTDGFLSWFFEVEDRYETYIEPTTCTPVKFVRNINEGGYKINRELNFNHEESYVEIQDFIKNNNRKIDIDKGVQDLISMVYYLRGLDISELEEGDQFGLSVFLDYETFDFNLKFLGRETIKTDFGKVRCLKFRPYVLSGRVFKEQESLTVWVTDDKNRLPISMRASLMVGSLRADLEQFKGLKNPFSSIVVD